MSALTDIEDDVKEFVTNFTTRAEAIVREKLPVIHDAAVTLEGLTQNKIVAEVVQLGGTVLPDSTVELIAGLIRDAGTAAAKIAELTAPEPAVPAGVDAEPDPDVPAAP